MTRKAYAQQMEYYPTTAPNKHSGVGAAIKQSCGLALSSAGFLGFIEMGVIVGANNLMSANIVLGLDKILGLAGLTVSVGGLVGAGFLFMRMTSDIMTPVEKRGKGPQWDQWQTSDGRSPMRLVDVERKQAELGRPPAIFRSATSDWTVPDHQARSRHANQIRAFLKMCEKGRMAEANFKGTDFSADSIRQWRDTLISAGWAEWKSPQAFADPGFRPQGWKLCEGVTAQDIMRHMDLGEFPVLKERQFPV